MDTLPRRRPSGNRLHYDFHTTFIGLNEQYMSWIQVVMNAKQNCIQRRTEFQRKIDEQRLKIQVAPERSSDERTMSQTYLSALPPIDISKIVPSNRVTRSMPESPSPDDVWTNENNSIQTSMPHSQASDILKDENSSIRTGNNENQESHLDCAAINSNGGETKLSSGELHPRPSLRAENGVPAQVVVSPGMILQVTVHSIDGFDDYAGFMDRTDPYVLLQVGKLKHKTSIKQDSGGKGVSFNETFDFYLKAPQLNKEENFLKIQVFDKDCICDDLLGGG